MVATGRPFLLPREIPPTHRCSWWEWSQLGYLYIFMINKAKWPRQIRELILDSNTRLRLEKEEGESIWRRKIFGQQRRRIKENLNLMFVFVAHKPDIYCEPTSHWVYVNSCCTWLRYTLLCLIPTTTFPQFGNILHFFLLNFSSYLYSIDIFVFLSVYIYLYLWMCSGQLLCLLCSIPICICPPLTTTNWPKLICMRA